MNSVVSLKQQPFLLRSLEEQLLVKSLGRPTPHLNIKQECKERDRTFVRQFRSSVYEKYPWMCGCDVQNALYCFPCLLLGSKDIWSSTGLSSLPHVSTMANKHADTRKHVNNVLELSALGVSQRTSTCVQHNQRVDTNCYIASQMIDFLKTCRDLDTTDGMSINVDNLTENCVLQSNLFQDDLLQCILTVCQDVVVEELNRTKYVAVMLEDTAAVSSDLCILLIFRYEIDGNLHERFWGLINIEEHSANNVLLCILKELKNLFDSCPNKIISLSFKGPSMIQIPAEALESKIREHFPMSNHILCYDHHLNTVIQDAALRNSSARKFLSCLSVFQSFFSSRQRLHVLETVASKRGICPPPGGWDFRFQTAAAVHQVQKEILECSLEFQNSMCSKTVQEARIVECFLEDREFLFWLNFFQKVMTQVENVDIELLTGQVDIWKLLHDFTSTLYEIQNQVSANCGAFFQERNQHKVNSLKEDSQEVCELIVAALQYHLQCKGHLEACKLLDCTQFIQYSKDFPDKLLNSTAELYSDINKSSLRVELDVMYERTDFREMEGCLSVLQVLHFCNLEETFPETMNLLRRIVTVPVKTSECERCPGTVERIKTFIKNSSITKHSAALIMLAAEKKMVSNIKDFNKRVLEKLANMETWMLEFNHQKQS